jgi:hypothetical protein
LIPASHIDYFQREHATAQLSKGQLREIAWIVSQHRLPDLYEAYTTDAVVDGKLWTLSVFQSGRVKRVFFYGRLTAPIWYFSLDFDEILTWSDSKNVLWKACLQHEVVAADCCMVEEVDAGPP